MGLTDNLRVTILTVAFQLNQLVAPEAEAEMFMAEQLASHASVVTDHRLFTPPL